MSGASNRVFVSGVTADVGPLRAAVAERLEDAGHVVVVQTEFQHGSTKDPSLLHKLQGLLVGCDLIVVIAGPDSGWRPSEAQLAPFRRIVPAGVERPSATQFEVYSARELGKRVVVFVADDALGTADPDQGRFLGWLEEQGVDHRFFSSDEHCLELLGHLLAAETDRPSRRWGVPAEVQEHVRTLREFVLERLSRQLDGQVHSVEDAEQFLAQRLAKADDGSSAVFPRAVLEAVERSGQVGYRFDHLVLEAVAGEGKSTAAHWLLARLSSDETVRRRGLVPMLVDCASLARLMARGVPTERVVEGWLSVAVAPLLGHRSSDAPDRAVVSQFVSAVRSSGLRLLLVVDGLDELLPSASLGRDAQVLRLLRGLERWQDAHGLPASLRIVTSRPGFESLYRDLGLTRFVLQPPDSDAIRNLVRASGIDPEAAGAFLEAFSAPGGLASRLVYFRPLRRFFEQHPEDVAHLAHDPHAQLRLMRFEVGHAVRTIAGEHPGSAALPGRLLNLLVLVACEALFARGDGKLGQLSLDDVSHLAELEWPAALAPEPWRRTPAKVLDVLVGQGQPDGAASTTFRLPHNLYRDYLLADGLVRLIQGDSPAAANSPPEAARAVAVRLARAYLGSEYVAQFVDHMIADLATRGRPSSVRKAFAADVVALMNSDKLPSTKPVERAECSPHGALLSLLLGLGRIPRKSVLNTADVSFQGVRVPSGVDRSRTRLPGDNWREADLSEADLRGLNLSGVDFVGARLDNALLTGANLSGAKLGGVEMENVAMGRWVETGQGTDLRQTTFQEADGKGANWFNYRFRGLSGYCCFWAVEPLDERHVVVASSEGRLLLFDVQELASGPRVLMTEHKGDILDVSHYPDGGALVTTGKDGKVLIHRLPNGTSASWHDGARLESIVSLTGLFPDERYPRRARFSASGAWLAVIARDPRVAFVRLGEDLHPANPGDPPVFGVAHGGPVMCLQGDVIEDPGAERAIDRFVTSGYDGRVVLWSEEGDHPWRDPGVCDDGAGQDIVRALRLDLPPGSAEGEGVWVATEREGDLRYLQVDGVDLEPDDVQDVRFKLGVFALAYEPGKQLLAVGLKSGEVRLYRHEDRVGIDFDAPLLCCTSISDDIVRALCFVDDGKRLVAVWWDGCVAAFDLADGSAIQVGEYAWPEERWHPETDREALRLDVDVDLSRSRGLSSRMKRYLERVGASGEEAGTDAD